MILPKFNRVSWVIINHFQRTFLHAGAQSLLACLRRSGPLQNATIAIFVCFVTKAVEDLSTQSFIAALKKCISLRGKTQTICSDNATNFVRAKNEIIELRQLFLSEFWNFIPPVPHTLGACGKPRKNPLNTILSALLESRFSLFMSCAILNSRPLCPISENTDDIDILTPVHFLIGSTFTLMDEPDVTHLNLDGLSRWQRVCQMQE